MSLPKKGSRTLIIEDRTYRWLIRKKPTYAQAAGFSLMTIAIALESDDPSGVLIVNTKLYRPDNWARPHQTAVSPGKVRLMIESAIENGWNPESSGTFHLDYQLIRDSI